MDELEELRLRMSHLSDEELLSIVTREASEYREDALVCARKELRSRGIDYESAPSDDIASTENEPAEPAESVEPLLLNRATGCPVCNGRLRAGTLVAEKEITIIFSDNQEERFVQVAACSRCGLISMVVDLETAIEGR